MDATTRLVEFVELLACAAVFVWLVHTFLSYPKVHVYTQQLYRRLRPLPKKQPMRLSSGREKEEGGAVSLEEENRRLKVHLTALQAQIEANDAMRTRDQQARARKEEELRHAASATEAMLRMEMSAAVEAVRREAASEAATAQANAKALASHLREELRRAQEAEQAALAAKRTAEETATLLTRERDVMAEEMEAMRAAEKAEAAARPAEEESRPVSPPEDPPPPPPPPRRLRTPAVEPVVVRSESNASASSTSTSSPGSTLLAAQALSRWRPNTPTRRRIANGSSSASKAAPEGLNDYPAPQPFEMGSSAPTTPYRRPKASKEGGGGETGGAATAGRMSQNKAAFRNAVRVVSLSLDEVQGGSGSSRDGPASPAWK